MKKMRLMALPVTHKHVLVVDDEEYFRSVLVSHLKSLGVVETGEAN
jgi:two-component system response regulator